MRLMVFSEQVVEYKKEVDTLQMGDPLLYMF